jgi:hypothetical protein
MRPLSKSKILAHRQCAKRLWLEINDKDVAHYDARAVASFATGHSVGEFAQSYYDPRPERVVINAQRDGYDVAAETTAQMLTGKSPFFEAYFSANGAFAFADVVLPAGRSTWKIVEVKSSTSVKQYHRDDAAIQYFVATQSGVNVKAFMLAHIDSKWAYAGDGDYNGLLVETDVTSEVGARMEEVTQWIAEAQATARKRTEPKISTGAHCADPFVCGFFDYCSAQEPKATHPVTWLPRVQTKALKRHLANRKVIEMARVPDELLDTYQKRVKSASLSGDVYFDVKGAAAALKPHAPPVYFLDFETISFAIPLWAGTRPFQQVPFQFSCHRMSRTSVLRHSEFLCVDGCDPSKDFVDALLIACDVESSSAPIFVYSQGFEKARIRDLSKRFPNRSKALRSLIDRFVDLLPITKANYYHPSQHGSWSLKSVLPALVPDLSYSDLENVQDGGAAQQAFLEAIAIQTSPERKAALTQQLLAYCQLDTMAMVRIRKALLRHC